MRGYGTEVRRIAAIEHPVAVGTRRTAQTSRPSLWTTSRIVGARMTVFADSEGYTISRVSASGGKSEVFSKSDDRAFYPEFLSGGQAVLFSIKIP